MCTYIVVVADKEGCKEIMEGVGSMESVFCKEWLTLLNTIIVILGDGNFPLFNGEP